MKKPSRCPLCGRSLQGKVLVYITLEDGTQEPFACMPTNLYNQIRDFCKKQNISFDDYMNAQMQAVIDLDEAASMPSED